MGRERKYLVVTDSPRPPELDKVSILPADEYLEGKGEALSENLVVVNLCRSYQYLSKGYYVSLLAHARNQRVFPSLEMIEEISNPFAYFRALQDAGVDTIDFKIIRGRGRRLLPKVIVLDPNNGDEQEQAGGALVSRQGDSSEIRYERLGAEYLETTSVFGKTLDPRFRRECAAVHKVFPFPLLRIRMYKSGQDWQVGQIFPAVVSQLSPAEIDLLTVQFTSRAFTSAPQTASRGKDWIACLWDANDPLAPSDEATIEKLTRIAARNDVVVDVIGKDDLGILAEYDALFIRTVTAIDNYAFTFAKVAESLGMPVIDSPQSIIRCSNKIYLYELFKRNAIPIPETRAFSRRSAMDETRTLGFPLILKLPDGSFSQAVTKVGDWEEFQRVTQEMFKSSPLLLAQVFTPTNFDWRVAILDSQVLFVCRYHMVKDHWQIVKRAASGSTRFGRVEAVPIDAAPEEVRGVALRAAALIGDGFYGVDVKETADGPVVIEVNDNPNLEAGYEDAVEKDQAYEKLIAYFLRRFEDA